MKRRRLILFGALVVLAAGVVAVWPRGPREPVYQGRKLSQWMKQANTQADGHQQEQAFAAIHSIGTNALPYLMSEFTRPKSKLAVRLNALADGIGWDLDLDEGETKREWARDTISFLGPASAPALPELAACLQNEEYSEDAALAMSGGGAAAWPFLTNAAASTNVTTRWGATVGLSFLMDELPEAIPLLLKMHEDPDRKIRLLALMHLGDSHLRPDLTLPPLMKALTNADPVTVECAARSLSQMKDAAKPAVPRLLQVLTNGTTARTQIAARKALEQIDPAALPKPTP